MKLNDATIVFLVINAGLLIMLPRQFALTPLLVGVCYMTLGQGIEIGPLNFPVIRMLLGVAFLRVLVRRELITGEFNFMDWLMVVWAAWAVLCSLFYENSFEVLVNHLGLVYNTCGIYFVVRIFCQSQEDLETVLKIAAMLLVPVAIAMLLEKMTGHNAFSALGGVPEFSAVRDGKIRAQGPFAHPILAGTVGAVCMPLMIGLWGHHQRTALIGMAACLAIVFSCTSSGPILSLLCGIAALFMWRFRHRMRLIRWLGVFIYLGLDLVMQAPAYFIISRFDAVGGSTGFHRAKLIESAFQHLSEWWLMGTDYTRHWMVTGVTWSADHTDITNHYIRLGIIGGLPLMILFIAVLVKGFFYVGDAAQSASEHKPGKEFFIWALGASLFAHAASCVAVSYFDQSFIFLYVNLAAIASVWSAYKSPESNQEEDSSARLLQSPD